MRGKNIKQYNVLLVIRHPVGGIRTFIKYVYKKKYFSNCRFIVVMPCDDLSELFIQTMKDMDIEYRLCEENLPAIIYCIFSVLREVDIKLIHSHGYTSGVCACLLARIFCIPHIMTVHDVLLESQFSGIRGYLKRYLLPFFFNTMDVIHAVSHDVKDNIKRMLPRVKEGKIITILNGIDISLYNKNPYRNLHDELGVDKNCFIIGFLGRFMSQKGFRYLIDAISILDKDEDLLVDFKVVTVGASGFIREEKEIITRKNIASRFEFLPLVDNISDIIQDMDLIVVPSLWEACPLVPMEVLVSGIPLAASNCIGLREVIRDTPTFVVKPGDSVDLARVIKECIFNNHLEEFQEYMKVATVRFDSAIASEKLHNIYSNYIF